METAMMYGSYHGRFDDLVYDDDESREAMWLPPLFDLYELQEPNYKTPGQSTETTWGCDDLQQVNSTYSLPLSPQPWFCDANTSPTASSISNLSPTISSSSCSPTPADLQFFSFSTPFLSSSSAPCPLPPHSSLDLAWSQLDPTPCFAPPPPLSASTETQSQPQLFLSYTLSPLPSAGLHADGDRVTTSPVDHHEHPSSPAVGVKPAEPETKPASSAPPQQSSRKRSSRRRAPKGKCRAPAPNAKACRQNWEAMLQGVQLDDMTMLKGKWYWQLRAEKAKAGSPTLPAEVPTPIDAAGVQSTQPGVAQLPARSRLNSLYQWIQQAK